MSSPAVNSTSLRFTTFRHVNNDLNLRTDHIPDHNTMTDSANDDGASRLDLGSKMHCCCGRSDCAYLEHNAHAMLSIEQDLDRAAKLGQALLSRHESFISDSQEQTSRLNNTIAHLETERTDLQNANEKIVAENRQLLEQLEAINASYKSSEDAVTTLEALLRDTEIEVRRLNQLAKRAEELGARVVDLDKERGSLSRRLNDGDAENKSLLMRWRESERKVRQLELEVEKIEWEAKLEREKHEEIVAKLERESLLERELGGAEGRLKGAAAVQGIEKGNKNNVVSSFVRDILQDNATLQAGIIELRELLQSSNDEVQNLRQQIVHHQPIDADARDAALSQSLPLSQHLDNNEVSPAPSQHEVHVHHHYHAKLTTKRDRTPTVKRGSRRRAVMGRSTPDPSVPSTPISRPQRYLSSPVITLHQPQPMRNRWSTHSAATLASTVSSLPSSPRSGFDRYSSIFDRLDIDEESSRPTSPESAAGFVSPRPQSKHAMMGKDDGMSTFDAVMEAENEIYASPLDGNKEYEVPLNNVTASNSPEHTQELTPKPSQVLIPTTTVDSHMREPRPPDTAFKAKPETRLRSMPALTDTSSDTGTFEAELDSIPEIRPSLHRSSSHDSLVSISGMDIHLAKRPSASLRIRGNAAHFAIPPSSARNISVVQPVAEVVDVTVTSSQRSFSSDTQGPAGRRLQSIAGGSYKELTPQTAGLGRLGGWMRGKWGVAPTKSVADLRSTSLSTAPAPAKPITMAPKRPSLPLSMSSSFMARTPGINQSGAIPGLWTLREPVTAITTTVIDEEGLKEVLDE